MIIIKHKLHSYCLPHESEHAIDKLNQITGIKASVENSVRGMGGTLIIISEEDLSIDNIFSYGALTQTLLHNAIIR